MRKIFRALVRPFGWAMAMRALALRARLNSIARRVDSFDAIGNMFLALNRLQSEADRSEHSSSGDQLLSAVELTALAFAERGPSRREPHGSATSAKDLAALHSLLPKLIHASVLAQFGRLAPLKTTSGSVPARITHAAISREVYLRLPRFMAKERETLEALFTPDVSETLRERVGFTPSTLFSLYDALHSYVPQAAADRIRAADAEFDEQLAQSQPLRDAVDSHPQGPDAARAQILTAYTFSQLSALVSLSLEQIVERAGLGRGELEPALERLSIDLDVPHSAAVRQFLRGDNLMRTRPFVVRTLPDGSRRWLLVQPTSLIFGMRLLFEEVLLAQPIDQAYSKARGALLEQMGMHALVNLLQPDVALANVDYRGADRNFETDGLIVIGHIAIVVEAKSNRLTPYALAGAPERLWRELGPIISKAAEQAERLRPLLTDGTTLHVRSSTDLLDAGQSMSRNWDLDVSGVTDVFTIALTLEDLNFIATISTDLVESGLISPDTPPPWVVNVHDLEITARVLERPSEFVHFLARRRRAAQTNRILANDELDYLMHYLKFGLFSDGPQAGSDLVMSLTDELDAWYFFEIGEVAAPAPKPAQPIAPDLSDVLELLEQHRPDRWLEASMRLLDLEVPLREQVSGAPRDLRTQTRVDRQSHSMHIAVNDFGFVAMSFPRGMRAQEMGTRLSGYTTLRRYASRIDTVYAFGCWQGSSAAFDIFLSDYEPWAHNEELDRLVSEAGLSVAERPQRPLSNPTA